MGLEVVPKAGIEPALSCENWILNLPAKARRQVQRLRLISVNLGQKRPEELLTGSTFEELLSFSGGGSVLESFGKDEVERRVRFGGFVVAAIMIIQSTLEIVG